MINKILMIIVLACSLSSCVFVAGAAAGAAGVAVVYDHRKLQNVLSDEKIASTISDQIKADPTLNESAHVNVTCFNGVVLLTGETPTADLRQQVENIAHGVPNISRVYNEITVQAPTSSIVHTSDAWITTKIKSQMLATKDLKSGTIKVVTENGSVYLMGVVSHEQADMAVDIARQVSGVQRVVKIFQYSEG